MMAPQLQSCRGAWRSLSRALGGLLLFFAITAQAALTIQVVAAPAAAVSALRAAAPDVTWLASPVPDAAADATLLWHPGREGGLDMTRLPSRPRLVVAQSRHDVVLRPEDSALFWGVDLLAQWRLAREIVPGLQRVGVFYHPRQQVEVQALIQEAGDAGVVARLLTRPPSARDVSELAQRSDALLGMADSHFFSRETAKVILLSAYRHQRPWIGPTPAFVAAGAVATRAVPKKDLIDAIIQQVRHRQTTGGFLPARTLEPRDVVCNQPVARSMSIPLDRVPCVSARGGA